MTSRQDTEYEAGFGSDHARGVLEAMRGSSARGQGRQCLLRRCATFEQAVGLDMARGSLKTGGALIEVTVDMDVSKFPALEAGFMVSGVVMGEGCVMVAASPPDFGASDSNLLFLGQGR